jgi:hypothetical protein
MIFRGFISTARFYFIFWRYENEHLHDDKLELRERLVVIHVGNLQLPVVQLLEEVREMLVEWVIVGPDLI